MNFESLRDSGDMGLKFFNIASFDHVINLWLESKPFATLGRTSDNDTVGVPEGPFANA